MTHPQAEPSVLEPETEAEAEVAEQVDEVLEAEPERGPVVGILVGSEKQREIMQRAGQVLAEAEVRYELEVVSVHRDPERVREYCSTARQRGLRVLIAGAALSAALPGLCAAYTDLPVIGVPLSDPRSAAGGLDAILGVMQLPAGVPVAAVGLDEPRNAAHVAVRILGA
jgi:5-(carboxyamino)imidazole ribonucleotide mutase